MRLSRLLSPAFVLLLSAGQASAADHAYFSAPADASCIWGGVADTASFSAVPPAGSALYFDSTQLTAVNGTSVSWTPLSTGSTSTHVLSLQQGGTTLDSVSISLQPAPTAPVLSSSAVQQTSASLSWTSATGGCVTGYKLYKRAGSSSTDTLFIDTTQNGVLDQDLTPGATYYYRVDAYDAAGQSLSSASLAVTAATAPTPTPTATPSATPTPEPTATAVPSATPTPLASATPTPTYNAGDGSALLGSQTPSPTPVATEKPEETPLTPAQKILRWLIGTGLFFVLLGTGLLAFWKRRTSATVATAGTSASEKKAMVPEVDPDVADK